MILLMVLARAGGIGTESCVLSNFLLTVNAKTGSWVAQGGYIAYFDFTGTFPDWHPTLRPGIVLIISYSWDPKLSIPMGCCVGGRAHIKPFVGVGQSWVYYKKYNSWVYDFAPRVGLSLLGYGHVSNELYFVVGGNPFLGYGRPLTSIPFGVGLNLWFGGSAKNQEAPQ